MKNEDISIFKFIWDKMGIKVFPYVSWPYGAIKLHFLQLETDAIRKIHRFFKTLQVWDVVCELSFCRSV